MRPSGVGVEGWRHCSGEVPRERESLGRRRVTRTVSRGAPCISRGDPVRLHFSFFQTLQSALAHAPGPARPRHGHVDPPSRRMPDTGGTAAGRGPVRQASASQECAAGHQVDLPPPPEPGPAGRPPEPARRAARSTAATPPEPDGRVARRAGRRGADRMPHSLAGALHQSSTDPPVGRATLERRPAASTPGRGTRSTRPRSGEGHSQGERHAARNTVLGHRTCTFGGRIVALRHAHVRNRARWTSKPLLRVRTRGFAVIPHVERPIIIDVGALAFDAM